MTDSAFADGTRITVVKDPGGTREARLYQHNEQISRVVIIPMLMRVGAAVLRMDGIGGVETTPDQRGRGHARRLMEFVVDHIRVGDAALSTLYGIEDFYQKFGYDTVGPEYTVTTPLANASPSTCALPPGWHVRPLTLDDLPAVMHLYHANTRRATGPLVRHDAGDDADETACLAGCDPDARTIGLRAWHKLRTIANGSSDDACRVLLDSAGQLAAYAWRGRGWYMEYRRRDMPDAFHLAEAMARDPIAADALLAACRHWASEAGESFSKVAFAMPSEGPLAAAATYEGGEVLAIYTRGGDFMGRVLDVDRLLQQLLPEFSARVQATAQPFNGQLTLRTELGESSLFFTPAGVVAEGPATGAHLTVELPQVMLARLCLGGFDNIDVLTRLPQQPSPAAAHLLRTLFPRRFPHIYPMDRF